MKKILCVIAISILYIISCNRNNVTSPIELIEGLTYPNSSMYSRNFRILSIDSAGNEDLSASAKFYRIAEYDKLDIYIEENEGYRKENIDYIVSEFNKHYDEEIRIYGNHTDVDGNNKIIIVLYDIKNYTGGNINGFFHYFDLMKDRLNNGEILYMNIKVVNQDADYMSGTILHELQHLINWNVNYIKNGSEMSTWLNEALSESTSVVFNEATASSRIFEFKNMNGYYCFYTWNLPTEKVFPNHPNSKYLFANYPSVSVFMNWLYQKNAQNSFCISKI